MKLLSRPVGMIRNVLRTLLVLASPLLGSVAHAQSTPLATYGIFNNLRFEDTPPIMSHWSLNGTAVTYINNSAQAHAGNGALKIDGSAPASIWGGGVAGTTPPVAGDTVGGYFWLKILSAPATKTVVDVRMTGFDSSNNETIYCNTRPVDLSKIPLNTWVRMELIPTTDTFKAGDVANFNIVSNGGLNCVIDDVTFQKVLYTPPPTPQPYGVFNNLKFEDYPPIMSHWSMNGTAVTYINNTAQAHAGHGAVKIDGTASISIWGGGVAGTNPPLPGDTVSGHFWLKLLATPSTETPVDVRMIGFDSANNETVYCNTRPVDLAKIPLNTWVKMDLVTSTATFKAGDAANFNIISEGGVNCLIDDISFGVQSNTPPPAAPDNFVSNGIVPPIQEYIGSTLNGNFEVGNASVGNQYWGQYVPNQGAVGGAPNMINLVTSPTGTEPGNIKNGNNMIEVIRGGTAWNIASLSTVSTDRLPKIGDIAGGSYWLYVPTNANTALGIPRVSFVYQSASGDVTVADSNAFPVANLVKGKWNEIPVWPLNNAAIPSQATGSAIIITAPQLNGSTNPVYALKYYIDEIRVGKIPSALSLAKASGLTDSAGVRIDALGANDTTLYAKAVVLNSQSTTSISATLVLKLFEGAVLKSTTNQAVTVNPKGASGIASTSASLSASLAGMDKSKLNAKLYLYNNASQQTLLATPFSLIQQTRRIAPNDSNIKYVGRWSGGSASYRSDWIRPYFKTAFTGSSIRIKLLRSASLSVTLNGVETQFSGVNGLVELGANLPAGTHTLRVAGLTYGDVLEFDGLYVDDVGGLAAPTLRPKTIEFIGDSITAWNNGYSWRVPEALNTESSRIAWPGIALVDGYGYYKPAPPLYGMSSAYFKIGMPDYGTAGNWNFLASPYTPDVVVINLGTNDGAQITGVPSFVTNFQNTYATFIQSVRAKFPNARIFVLRAFSIQYANVNTAVANAVQSVINAGDTKVHYIDTTSWGVQIGSDGIHPTDAGHVTITNQLVPILSPYVQ